jgi:hypothetical protein
MNYAVAIFAAMALRLGMIVALQTYRTDTGAWEHSAIATEVGARGWLRVQVFFRSPDNDERRGAGHALSSVSVLSGGWSWDACSLPADGTVLDCIGWSFRVGDWKDWDHAVGRIGRSGGGVGLCRVSTVALYGDEGTGSELVGHFFVAISVLSAATPRVRV